MLELGVLCEENKTVPVCISQTRRTWISKVYFFILLYLTFFWPGIIPLRLWIRNCLAGEPWRRQQRLTVLFCGAELRWRRNRVLLCSVKNYYSQHYSLLKPSDCQKTHCSCCLVALLSDPIRLHRRDVSVCVCVLVNLTLSHVKPRRLSEAVYDECEGLHRRVHFPGQFLHTPGLHLVLHTLMKRWTSNLICTLIQEGQKPRTDVKEKVTYYYEKVENPKYKQQQQWGLAVGLK